MKQSLDKTVRKNMISGRSIPAIVIDTFYDKVSVRLGNNGTIMRGLPLIGGPVTAGESVSVDFTTPTPTVIAQGKQGITSSDLDAALKALMTQQISGIPQIKIILFSGGGVVDMFDPSPEGLTSALSSANIGDVVWLPDTDIEADFIIPSGVTVSGISTRQSIIRGQVTLDTDCSLENLSVINAQRTSNEVIGVIAQGAGDPSWIVNCEIHAYNCADGIATGIQIQADTTLLQVSGSVVVADSKDNAEAHAFSGSGGECKIVHSRLYSKSADHYDGTTFYEYSNIGTVTELERACMIAVDTDYLYSFSSGFESASLSNVFLTKTITKPTTPTALEIHNSSSSSGPGTVCRMGDYVYIHKRTPNTDVYLREFNITDGTSVDVKVAVADSILKTIPFCIIDARKAMAVLTISSTIRYYIINFETGTSQLYYEQETTSPENPGENEDYQDYGDATGIQAIRLYNNDLMIVAYGKVYFTDASHNWDSYVGMYFMTKNWTQDGSWTLYEKRALPPGQDVWGDDLIDYWITPYSVDNKYLCFVPSYDRSSAYNSNSDPITNIYTVMFSLDLEELTLDSTYASYTFTGGFPDITLSLSFGVDHVNKKGYAYSYDGGRTDSLGITIYRYDPVLMTIEIVTTMEEDNTQIYFTNNKTLCYYLKRVSGAFAVYNCNDNSVVNEEITTPLLSTWKPDNIMDDNSNRIWFYRSTDAKIYGVRLSDGDDISFDPGLPAANASGSSNYLFALGDVFVLYRNQYNNGATTKSYWNLIKE